MKIFAIKGRVVTKGKLSWYSCEWCGDQHRGQPCDTCSMPPCRCLC